MPADWLDWHRPYDDPASPLTRRLACVTAGITDWLDRAPAGPLRAVSLCAGQGRDLIGALSAHRRRADVRALLVESDPRNAAVAVELAAAAGLSGVTVDVADASRTDAFAAAVPADLVLACGVFGNISDADIEHTVAALPSLCAEGATVVWTRHRRPPDRTPDIRRWVAQAGFEELSFTAPDDAVFTVGVARLSASPAPFVPGLALFTFIGDGSNPA